MECRQGREDWKSFAELQSGSSRSTQAAECKLDEIKTTIKQNYNIYIYEAVAVAIQLKSVEAGLFRR